MIVKMSFPLLHDSEFHERLGMANSVLVQQCDLEPQKTHIWLGKYLMLERRISSKSRCK